MTTTKNYSLDRMGFVIHIYCTWMGAQIALSILNCCSIEQVCRDTPSWEGGSRTVLQICYGLQYLKALLTF